MSTVDTSSDIALLTWLEQSDASIETATDGTRRVVWTNPGLIAQGLKDMEAVDSTAWVGTIRRAIEIAINIEKASFIVADQIGERE